MKVFGFASGLVGSDLWYTAAASFGFLYYVSANSAGELALNLHYFLFPTRYLSA